MMDTTDEETYKAAKAMLKTKAQTLAGFKPSIGI
jgi:hypothetical protein